MKKWHVVMLVLLLMILPLTTAVSGGNSTEEKVEDTSNIHYEVYPLPQNEDYSDSHFSITDEVNIVLKSESDEATTKDLLYEMLESKSFKFTVSQEVVSDRTNIIIGTKASKG